MELIERDAYVLWWLTQSWVTQIEQNDVLEAKITHVWLDVYKISLFVFQFDNPVPVVLTVAQQWERVVLAMWCAFTLEAAIDKSLSEGAQFADNHFGENADQSPFDSKKHNLIQLHIKQYLQPENYPDIAWLFDAPTAPYASLHNQFTKKWCETIDLLLDWWKEQWWNLYTYQYQNALLEHTWRVCLRILSDHHLPIRFGVEIPQWIRESERLTYWLEKAWNTKLNEKIHPFW